MTRSALVALGAGALLCCQSMATHARATAVAQAQAAPQTGQVSGVVRDSATRKPVAGAIVSFPPKYGEQLHAPEVYTAADGTFRLLSLPAGTYNVFVKHPGYATMRFGQERPDDPAQYFDLHAGEDAKGITLWLTPGGVISGTLRTTTGEPVPGMTVRPLVLGSTTGGRPTLKYQMTSMKRTNNRGEYRVVDLPPGKYLLEVGTYAPGSGQNMFEAIIFGYRNNLDPSMLYYPDAPTPIGAQVIDVEPGAEVPVNFIVPNTPTPALAISGRITGAPFDPTGQLLRLVTTDRAADLPSWMEIATTHVGTDGTFAFPYVPPGTYEIRGVFDTNPPRPYFDPSQLSQGVHPPLRVELASYPPAYWCRQEITVRDAALPALQVPAHVGMRIRGHLAFAGDVGAIDPSSVHVAVQSLDGWNLNVPPVGRTQPDGTFASVALPPGRYRVFVTTDANAVFADSALLFGREVLGRGVDLSTGDVDGLQLTITRTPTKIAGSVHDGAGKARPDARLVYFRTDGAWRDGLVSDSSFDVGSTRTDRFAGFDIQVLPGDYYVVALSGALPVGWQNQQFLQALAGIATKISPARGASVRQDLVVRPVPLLKEPLAITR